jgi:hypothetical protein
MLTSKLRDRDTLPPFGFQNFPKFSKLFAGASSAFSILTTAVAVCLCIAMSRNQLLGRADDAIKLRQVALGETQNRLLLLKAWKLREIGCKSNYFKWVHTGCGWRGIWHNPFVSNPRRSEP